MSEAHSVPKIHVIVLNWNGWRDTLACIESLQHLDYPCVKITVVDNASTDNSATRIRQEYPQVDLVVCEQNFGFAEGNNVGIRRALSQDCDYIWLLNNDTLVSDSCLSLMVEAAESDPEIGVVGPKIYYADPPNRIWFAGSIFRPWFGQSVMLGCDQDDDGVQWETNRDAAFITGCAMLVKAEVFQRIGLLDPDFFFIAEDLDFGLRVMANGWRNTVVPAAKIWHKVSASSGGTNSPFNLYYFTRNRLLVMRKRGAPRYYITFALHFFGSCVVQYLLFSLLGKCSFACFKAVCLGIRDFASGRFGAMRPSTARYLRSK